MENSKSENNFIHGLTPDIMQGYLKGTLSAEMMEKVERYLEENPFEAEAMDGLKTYSVELNKELADLNQRISTKISPQTKRSKRYWQVAAVLAMLMVSGLVIYLQLPTPESTPIAINQQTSDPLEEEIEDINQSPVSPLPETKSNDVSPEEPAAVTPMPSEEIEPLAEVIPNQEPADPVPAAVPGQGQRFTTESISESITEETSFTDIQSEQTAAFEKAASVNSRVAKKSAAGLAAPDTGFVLSEKGNEMPLAQPPDDWDHYLANHLKYPEQALTEGIEGTVKLRFQVDTAGKPVNFEFLIKLGYGCDEEAVRLLINGPPWKPAQLNGVPLVSNAEIGINFQLKKDH